MIEVHPSSGNVFADLGLKDSDELFSRAQIGFYIYKTLKAKKLKKQEISKLLNITLPEVSSLMNGQCSRFTLGNMFDFLKRLDRTVTIKISPHRLGEPYQQVTISEVGNSDMKKAKKKSTFDREMQNPKFRKEFEKEILALWQEGIDSGQSTLSDVVAIKVAARKRLKKK